MNPSVSLWRRCWPRPVLSWVLWVLWLLLVNSLSVGQMLLGAFWAWLIPFYTQSFWPGVMSLRKPWLAAKFLGVVVWDILLANWVVARLILRPADRLQPAFMLLPLDVREDFTITILASTISLTPGTVSADLSIDRRHLLIHALHVENEQEAIAQMKQRYEAPLKEIFEC
jgi:multicomponent K+:H+ antiporter subunit E